MKRLHIPIVLLFALLLPVSLQAQDAALNVVASTTIIADVARNVGGDLVNVTALIPPDSDVHAFQPAPQDAVMIQQADVVLVNGANLEENLLSLIDNAATAEPVVVSGGVPMLAFGGHDHDHEAEAHAAEEEHDHDDDAHEHDAEGTIGHLGEDADCGDAASHEDEAGEHDHGACDPHVWMNPHNVEIWADNIAAAFAAADPANADTYHANAEAYAEQLEALDAELEAMFASIPEANRVIITNHEFLAYLAARYDLEIVGTVLPSVSTLAEPAPQEVAALIETIEAAGVAVIFGEVSNPNALTQVIAQDVGDVEVVSLYSESLSGPDGAAATYIDYMRTNAQLIVDALGGSTES